MSAPVRTASAPPAAPRGPLLPRWLRPRGLVWLVWRQHRTAILTVLAATVVGVVWMALQRATLIDALAAAGPVRTGEDIAIQDAGAVERQFRLIADVGVLLSFLPLVLGVFLGAPLLAGDLETGTAKLVGVQSVSRLRWLTAKLGLAALVTFTATFSLGFALEHWWRPGAYEGGAPDWVSASVFDTTPPVAVALGLFTVVTGVALGLVLRRTLRAMAVTLAVAAVAKWVWSRSWIGLGDSVVATTDGGVRDDSPLPVLPAGALELDRSYVTADGTRHGWSTCHDVATDAAHRACLDEVGIVGWAVEYLPRSEMAGMQWLGAGLLLALTAALAAAVLLGARRALV